MSTEQGYLLIVEDDADIRDLLETTLMFKEYRVLTAQNGREALEIIERERPAVVIADIMMPQLDGFGLVHRLRINPATRDIPVVFITATYVSREDREFAIRIGATQFIQKPVDLDMFLKTIDELLKQEPRAPVEPLDEFKFYDGYRQRLGAKLEEKVKQIARDEHLLAGQPDAEDQDIQVSIRHAIQERDELRLLLDEIHKQLERLQRAE